MALRTMIKKEWGCYRVFVTKGTGEGRKGKSDLRLVTLAHADLLPRPSPALSHLAMSEGERGDPQKGIQALQVGKKEPITLYKDFPTASKGLGGSRRHVGGADPDAQDRPDGIQVC